VELVFNIYSICIRCDSSDRPPTMHLNIANVDPTDVGLNPAYKG
jgi:hypothetical protein